MRLSWSGVVDRAAESGHQVVACPRAVTIGAAGDRVVIALGQQIQGFTTVRLTVSELDVTHKK